MVGEGQQSGATDVFGHKYLSGTGKALEIAIKTRFGCKVRSVELNLPQRCAAHLLSDTDIRESIAIGRAAVQAAAEGKSGGVMMLQRKSTSPYETELQLIDVALVANQTRYVPREFINEAGNDVTDACCAYLLPLIQGERELVFEGGLPLHTIID
jgi:6-phosphofructokinase 1